MSLGFATAIKKALLGKTVEIYQGDTHESLLKAEKDIERKSVLRGVLIDVIDECVVVRVNVNGESTPVYINSWSIQTILEPRQGIGIHSVYHNAESRKIK